MSGWEHRFIRRHDGTEIVLAEVFTFEDLLDDEGVVVQSGLGWTNPYIEDVTPERLVVAWNKGLLVEQADGSLKEQEKSQ